MKKIGRRPQRESWKGSSPLRSEPRIVSEVGDLQLFLFRGCRVLMKLWYLSGKWLWDKSVWQPQLCGNVNLRSSGQRGGICSAANSGHLCPFFSPIPKTSPEEAQCLSGRWVIKWKVSAVGKQLSLPLSWGQYIPGPPFSPGSFQPCSSHLNKQYLGWICINTLDEFWEKPCDEGAWWSSNCFPCQVQGVVTAGSPHGRFVPSNSILL